MNDMEEWGRFETKFLGNIRPQEWFNIPHPLIEAVTCLIDRAHASVDRILMVSQNVKALESKVVRREKR